MEMNFWQALLGPVSPPDLTEGVSKQVHLLADEADPMTGKPASRGGQRKPVAAPKPAPVLADASIPEGMTSPEPDSRKRGMTYPEAIAIRERARNRQPVDRMLVLEANQLVQETRRRAMPTRESYGGEQ